MSTDMFCSYDGRREEVLVAYLYDDIAPAERHAFDTHLASCLVCRTELEALGDVRAELGAWTAPEVADGIGGTAPRTMLRLVDAPVPAATGWRRLADAPVWMQAAAAMLVIAASLGLANINLTYSPQAGLSVSTGWMAAPPPAAAPAQPAVADADPAPWRAELTALEQKLTTELQNRNAAAPAATPSTDDEATLRRVRSLIDESERRQQRELALRVGEVARDAQVQRQADLVRIDRSLGLIQSRTGVEVMRTQQQLNSLAQRVSQRQ
jgi:hypothetical protein